MELIEREKLRESLMHEQAKWMLSKDPQMQHTSAGYLLAVAELDSQLTVDAIPVEWIRKYAEGWRHTVIGDQMLKMIDEWEKSR